MQDAEIITRILAGETHLYGRLVERYAGYVWALCVGYIPRACDREDVVQETFADCYLRLDALKDRSAFGAWLGQAARRNCLNRLRANRRRDAAMARYRETVRIPEIPKVDEAMDREDVYRGIRGLVRGLPGKYREPLTLFYSQGCSAAEGAAFLGITRDAFKKRLQRARKILKDRMDCELEAALGPDKPKAEISKRVMAALPLGQAAWLGKAGITTSATAAGGIILVTKKVGITLAILAIVLVGTTLYVHEGFRRALFGESTLSEEVPSSQSPAEKAAGGPDDAAAAQLAAPEDPGRADLPGGVSDQLSAGAVDGNLLVDTDEAEKEHEPEETSPATVSGRVTNERGFPFSEAAIRLEVCGDVQGYDILETYDAGADEDGFYEIAGITTFGKGLMYASARGHVSRKHVGLSVQPGDELDHVDFTLPEGRYFVAGEVVDAMGRPISGAAIHLRRYGYRDDCPGCGAYTSMQNFTLAHSERDGYFEIAVEQEGLCDFSVIKPGYGPGYFPGIHTGTLDVRLVLSGEGAISGRVAFPDETPVAGAGVEVTGEAYGGGVSPRHTGEERGTFHLAPVTTLTNASGEYLVQGLGEAYVYTVELRDIAQNEAEPNADDNDLPEIYRVIRDVVGTPPLARRAPVYVEAGKTTTGVDMVLQSPAVVRGRVADASSGLPIPRLGIAATPEDVLEAESVSSILGFAWTDPDGSYELVLPLDGPTPVRIIALYMMPCCTRNATTDEHNPVVDLAPGGRRDVSFSVDAPVTAPIRVIDGEGAPIAGAILDLRDGMTGEGCSGLTETDDQGRFTWFGAPPRRPCVVTVYDAAFDGTRLGQSEPFTGEPGETLPETVIVCASRGGVEGVLVDADGFPVANADIRCRVRLQDGTEPPTIFARTDDEGTFCLLRAIPAAWPLTIEISLRDPDGTTLTAIIEDVEVVADQVTDVGALIAEPLDKEVAMPDE